MQNTSNHKSFGVNNGSRFLGHYRRQLDLRAPDEEEIRLFGGRSVWLPVLLLASVCGFLLALVLLSFGYSLVVALMVHIVTTMVLSTGALVLVEWVANIGREGRDGR